MKPKEILKDIVYHLKYWIEETEEDLETDGGENDYDEGKLVAYNEVLNRIILLEKKK